MYKDFAYIYDSLINKDIDYEQICSFLQKLFMEQSKKPKIICDLACGTGNVTLPLARQGYDMIGVDISENMLDVAREKSREENLDILFIRQNMKDLDLYGSCDAFLCMTDGFNYITSLNTLKKIFTKIRTCFIEPDGVFVFDISSPYKLENTLGSNTFIYNTDDIFYTWENKYKKPFCKMELNFFKKGESGFDRFEEVQIQRAYSEKEIKDALVGSGFSVVDVYGGYDFSPAIEDSQRLVFVAKPEL